MGYFISIFIGLVVLHAFGSLSLIELAIAAMHLDYIHPSAGANPLVILLSPMPLHFNFLLFPVLLGTILLIIISKINLIFADRRLTLK